MIVVAGGTGTLGQRLVPRLIERGIHVLVFTRAVVFAAVLTDLLTTTLDELGRGWNG